MPIGVNQYQILTPEQANPLGHGIAQAIQAMMQMQESRNYAAQAKKQELENPFVARLQEELLKNKQQENQWYGPKIKSEIGLQGAQSGYYGEETKTSKYKREHGLLEPELVQILKAAYGGSMPSNDSTGSSQAPSVASIPNIDLSSGALQLPENKSAIAQAVQQQLQSKQPNIQTNVPELPQMEQQQEQSQKRLIPGTQIPSTGNPLNDAVVMKSLGMTSLMNPERYLGAGGKALSSISKEISTQYPNLSPEEVIDARNQFMSGNDTYQDQEGKSYNLTPAISSAINKNYKGDTDVSQRSQQRFASTLEDIFKISDSHVNDAAKFVSIAGKVKGGIEAAKQQVGENDPSYMAYRNFMDEDVPAMVTEIIRAGGAHSTNAQKAVALLQAMPKNSTNEKLFKSDYEELKKIYRTVGKAASIPSYKNVSKLTNNNSASNNEKTSSAKYDFSNHSKEDLEKIARGEE